MSVDNELKSICNGIKKLNPIDHEKVRDLWIACGLLPKEEKREDIKEIVQEEIEDLKLSTHKSIVNIMKALISGFTAGIAIAIYEPLRDWIESLSSSLPMWLAIIITIVILFIIVIMFSYITLNYEKKHIKKETAIVVN